MLEDTLNGAPVEVLFWNIGLLNIEPLVGVRVFLAPKPGLTYPDLPIGEREVLLLTIGFAFFSWTPLIGLF
jgi:hypothetical protein